MDAPASSNSSFPDREILDFVGSKEKLQVVVEAPSHHPLPVTKINLNNAYFLPSTGSKGLALILNISELDSEEYRNGSLIDVQYLSELFTQLDYKLHPENVEDREKPRKSKQEMELHIQEFIKKCNDEKPSSAIIFIGSHGKYHNQISTSDAKHLDLHRDIVDECCHSKCPGLKGKPKMFFIQACQSYHRRSETDSNVLGFLQENGRNNEDEGEHGEESSSTGRSKMDSSAHPLRRPAIEDVLIYTAVMPGQGAQRDRYKGSWLPFCLTYMMMKHALKMISLQMILNKVEKMLENIKAENCVVQVPVLKELKFKPLYFSEIPVGRYGVNYVKKYCRLPTGLREFPVVGCGVNPKWVIISAVSSQITCAKIMDSLENVHFQEWIDFTLSFYTPCDESENVVQVVTNCSIENLKRLNKVDLSNSTKNIILVISEEEQKVKVVIEDLSPWTSKVELSVDGLAWDDLTLAHQDEVSTKLQQNFHVKLENGKLHGKLLADLITGEEIKLFKNTLPEQLNYYVERSVLTRRMISNALFKRDSASSLASSPPPPDIFLISGVDRYRLSALVKNEVTGTSSEYLQGRTTSKFLSLDNDSPTHLERVFAQDGPIHLLHYENKRLTWMRTKGELATIQNYVSGQDSQVEYKESDFCPNLSPDSNLPICISDGPGMGKSVLLAEMGRKLSQLFHERLVFYVALRKIMEQLKRLKLKSDSLDATTIEKVLQDIVCENVIGEAVLHRIKLKYGSGIAIELLLDGLDEVDSSDSTLAIVTLNLIRTSFKSVRLWVTTRPHLLGELENHLQVLGYNILPFREEDQVQFLTTFWQHRRTELNRGKTKMFAQHCLQSLKEKMNALDHDIAGIPLLCLLIGEVYEEDVMEFADLENSTNNPAIQLNIVSVTKLYQRMIGNRMTKYRSIFAKSKIPEEPGLFTKLLHLLIYKKLDKYSDSSREDDKLSEQKLKEMHAGLALAEIFPAYLKKIKGLLAPVQIDEVLKVGLVTTTNSTQSPRFIHRTFAEYFVAWFLVDRLTINETWSGELIHFLLEWALGRQTPISDVFFRYLAPAPQHENEIYSEPSLVQYSFSQPVLVYFLNSLIDDSTLQNIPDSVINSLSSYGSSVDTMMQITSACICSDLVNIFKLFMEAKLFAHFPATIFHPIFLTMAIDKCGLELIKIMLVNVEKHFPASINWREEALEGAVFRGEFCIVELLLKEVKGLRGIIAELGESEGAGELMFVLLVHSKTNPCRLIIDQKVEVLRKLYGINPRLLGAKGPKQGDETPLLYGMRERVTAHVKLLIELVNLGADTLVRTKEGDTILHLNKGRNHPSSYDYNLLLSSIPTDKLRILGQAKNKDEDTPLMTLVRFMDPDPETVEMFLFTGTDFNCANADGYSALAIAITNGRSGSTISNLLKCTADPTWKGRKGENLLHVAAWYGHVEAAKIILEDHKLQDLTTAMDSEGLMPLDYAIKSDYFYGARCETGLSIFKRGGKFKEDYIYLHFATQRRNLQSVRLLLALGFDVNLQEESQGNTPLHLVFGKNDAYYNFEKRFTIAKTLVDGGADPNILNGLGQTTLHIALKADYISLEVCRYIWSKTDISKISSTFATLALRVMVMNDFNVNDVEGHEGKTVDRPSKKPKRAKRSLELEPPTLSLKTMTYLIQEKGADVNWRNDSNESLLHMAPRMRYNDVSLALIKHLIEHGADVTAVDSSNQTFLHTYITNYPPASSNTHFHDLVKFLLARDTSYSSIFHIPTDGSKGETPLHLAMCYLEPLEETLKLLYSHGVAFNSIDRDGNSLFAYAIMGEQRKELLSFLIEHGADYKYINSLNKCSMLHIAVEAGNLDALKYLWELGGLDVNEVDGDGCTPTDIAMRNGGGQIMIDWLLQNGGQHLRDWTPPIWPMSNAKNMNMRRERHLNVHSHSGLGIGCNTARFTMFH